MTARIYQPSRATTQSGLGKTHSWILEYEPATQRSPEPLMGWTSAADTLNQVRLSFASRDEAVSFADRQGLVFSVQEPAQRRVRPKSYTDRFRPVRNR